MEWSGGGNESPFALVGKGVVFDTGGISLKPAGGMEDMTMDMGGAGVVAGVMKTLALRKAKANIVGLVGLVENMPDAKAQRPGDVVKSMKGETIEVINTDAEGRLVLADILWYAQKTFKPSGIINLATLTGAIIVASQPSSSWSPTPILTTSPRRPAAPISLSLSLSLSLRVPSLGSRQQLLFLVDHFGWTWFEQDENAWRKRYPKITKKIDSLESEIQNLKSQVRKG